MLSGELTAPVLMHINRQGALFDPHSTDLDRRMFPVTQSHTCPRSDECSVAHARTSSPREIPRTVEAARCAAGIFSENSATQM